MSYIHYKDIYETCIYCRSENISTTVVYGGDILSEKLEADYFHGLFLYLSNDMIACTAMQLRFIWKLLNYVFTGRFLAC